MARMVSDNWSEYPMRMVEVQSQVKKEAEVWGNVATRKRGLLFAL